VTPGYGLKALAKAGSSEVQFWALANIDEGGPNEARSKVLTQRRWRRKEEGEFIVIRDECVLCEGDLNRNQRAK
jgi:hypothetical protein